MHVTRSLIATLLVAAGAATAHAQLAPSWMLPAAAHTAGSANSFWVSDISIHNPHEYNLPVVVHLLPSDRENWSAPAIDIDLYPWETFNLWDALGPELFDHYGTAAVLVYAAPELSCSDAASCDFLVSSRTYTPTADGNGEYAQTIPAFNVQQGCDWSTLAYATGILNDGPLFRTNVGVASWTEGWTTVQLDVQDAAGNILSSELIDVPPFGHVQHRLNTAVEGGTLVFYLTDGPDDSLVYPYASVVNQNTNDPSFQFAMPSIVGASVTKNDLRQPRRRVVPQVTNSLSPASPRGGGQR